MSDLITDGKVLIEWLTEDLSSGKSVQSSKWRDLWARLIEGSYSDDQAEFLFQRVTAIGRQFGALGTFKVRASEGRRVWRYAKQHKENVLALLRSSTGYHKIIAQLPTTIDTTWRESRSRTSPNGTFIEEEVLAMISQLNEFELSTVHAFLSQLLSSHK